MTTPATSTCIRAYIIFRYQTPGTTTSPSSSDTAAARSETEKEMIDQPEIFYLDWNTSPMRIYTHPLATSADIPEVIEPANTPKVMQSANTSKAMESANMPKAMDWEVWDKRHVFSDIDYSIFKGGSVTIPDSSEESSQRVVDRFFLKISDQDTGNEKRWLYEDTDPSPEALDEVKLAQARSVEDDGGMDLKSLLEWSKKSWAKTWRII